MNKKKNIVIVSLFLLIYCSSFLSLSQQNKGVLEPENANEARLNNLQPPEQVMDAIGVVPGMVVAEIGAGHGRYVVQLAVRVGDSGKVYAEDINADSLRHLNNRCQRWGLKHVETIVGDVNDPKLPKNKLDLIFIISAYHHFDDPVALLRNARSSLKHDGKLAIGEWLPRNNNAEMTTPEQMETQMKEAGYKLDRIETFLKKNNMYIYVFSLDDSH